MERSWGSKAALFTCLVPWQAWLGRLGTPGLWTRASTVTSLAWWFQVMRVHTGSSGLPEVMFLWQVEATWLPELPSVTFTVLCWPRQSQVDPGSRGRAMEPPLLGRNIQEFETMFKNHHKGQLTGTHQGCDGKVGTSQCWAKTVIFNLFLKGEWGRASFSDEN